MHLNEVMTRQLITVPPDESVHHVREIMTAHGIHHLPVMDGARLVGVVTDTDLHTPVAESHAPDSLDWFEQASIEQVMSKQVVTMTPATTVRDAARVMRRRNIGCVPVAAADGRIVGIVTASDLLDILSRRRESGVSLMGLRLWAWWVVATVLGQLIALVIAAVYNAVVSSIGQPGGGALFLLVALGAAFEAATVGAVQWFALRRALARVSPRRWVLACAGGAWLGWSMGMAVGGFLGPGRISIITNTMLTGAVIGLVLGCAQWLVLRAHAPRAGIWILLSTLAWIPALLVMMAGEEAQELATGGRMVAVGLGSTIATGALVGAGTGLALALLVRWRSADLRPIGSSPPVSAPPNETAAENRSR